MDFYKDIAQIAKDILDHYEVGYSDLTTDRGIVERWATLQLKLIRIVPRKVLKSNHVMQQVDVGIQQALNTIETKLTKGEDINPYLSKGIFRAEYTDYLFSDWGIFHLHVSESLDGKFFMARSDSLLFMMLAQDCAYFIDVRAHDEQFVFAQKALLDIVHTEWPHVIEPFRLKGITELSHELDDPASIAKMRKAGVNVIHRIGSDFYAPMGGGITTARTSMEVTIQVDRFFQMAKSATEYVDQGNTQITQRIAEATGAPCISTDFHLELTERGFFVLDRISKCGFPIKT